MDDSTSKGGMLNGTHNGTHNGARADRHHGALALSARFDRSLVWHRGRSVRYLVAEVVAPPAPGGRAVATPLNLALVLASTVPAGSIRSF